MSVSRKRNTAVVALFLSCCLLFIWLAGKNLLPVCPSKYLLGLPCPGCGGVRSALALMRGDILRGLWHNPLSVLFMIFTGASVVWLIVDIIRDRDTYWAIYRHRWSRTGTLVVVAVLVVNWVWNIIKYM